MAISLTICHNFIQMNKRRTNVLPSAPPKFYVERDFTKCNMFLDQHPCCSWNNIPINQSELRDKITGNVNCSLTTRVMCFYILVIQPSFPSDFRDELWVGLGLGFVFQQKKFDPGICLTWQNHMQRFSKLWICHGAHSREEQGHADEDVNSNNSINKTSGLDKAGQGKAYRQETPGVTSRPDEIKLNRQDYKYTGKS